MIALVFVALLVLGMLALVVSVIVGAVAAGNLWLLLPLAFYAYAFWCVAGLAKSMDLRRYSVPAKLGENNKERSKI